MSYAIILNITASQRGVFEQVFHGAQTDMLDLNVPPHLTLAIFEEVDTACVTRVMADFARAHAAIDLFIHSLALFPVERPAVYAAPLVSCELLDLHRQFHEALGPLSATSVEYYQPDGWVPHVSLGMDNTLEDALEILRVAYQANLRGTYRFDEIVLVEYPPVKYLATFPLNAPDRDADGIPALR